MHPNNHKNKRVVVLNSEPKSFATKWAPKVVVLLDRDTRVLDIEGSRAGTSFNRLVATEQEQLHAQLHPGCSGNCRFLELWKKAWKSLSSRRSIEWEVDDTKLHKRLRLNLVRPPDVVGLKKDRRRNHVWLTITDITKLRREHEALIRRERALVTLLKEQGADREDLAVGAGVQKEKRYFLSVYEGETSPLIRQVILAQEQERKRIAADLHDSITQSLGVIKYNIEANVAQLSKSQPNLDLSLFEDQVDRVKDLVEEVRRISNNLAPSMLDDFGLLVALDWLCREFRSKERVLQTSCDLSADESSLSNLVKIAVFRVVQESLNNIAKHSLASTVGVSLKMVNDELQLEIIDDGVGLDLAWAGDVVNARDGGLGLYNMRERVLASGGEFSMDSTPGEGVRINACWSRHNRDLLSEKSVLDGVSCNG